MSINETMTMKLYEPKLINGLTISEIEAQCLPCPFCGETDIKLGKTNNHINHPNWEAIFQCTSCHSNSFIWNIRIDNK